MANWARGQKGWSKAHLVSGKRIDFILSEGLILLLLSLPCIGFPQGQSPRTIRIKIAMDENLKFSGMTKIAIKQWIRNPSQLFRKQFDIQFEVKGFEYWTPESGQKPISDLMSQLRNEVTSGDFDIFLGIISPDRIADGSSGLANYLQGYILLRAQESKSAMATVLLHELCHIFGGLDLNERNSVMEADGQGLKFDEFTSKVVLLHRQRNFQRNSFPLPPERLDEAISLYRQRASLKRGESRLNWVLANLYLQKHDYPLALRECLEALASNPEAAELHGLLGTIYQDQGEVDRAIAEYQYVLSFEPALPETHFNLGLLLIKKGQVEAATSEFRRAVELRPGFAAARNNLSFLYLQNGKFDQAIGECRCALSSSPELVEALCNLGAALLMKRGSLGPSVDIGDEARNQEGNGIVEETVALCRKALSLNPSLAEAHNILGIAYEYLEKKEDAKAEFMKALESHPDFVEANFNLGVLYFKCNDFERAAFHLKKILDVHLSGGLGFEILAKIFQNQKNMALFQVGINGRENSKNEIK